MLTTHIMFCMLHSFDYTRNDFATQQKPVTRSVITSDIPNQKRPADSTFAANTICLLFPPCNASNTAAIYFWTHCETAHQNRQKLANEEKFIYTLITAQVSNMCHANPPLTCEQRKNYLYLSYSTSQQHVPYRSCQNSPSVNNTSQQHVSR